MQAVQKVVAGLGVGLKDVVVLEGFLLAVRGFREKVDYRRNGVIFLPKFYCELNPAEGY